MKKFLLSVFVIFSFTAYTFSQRNADVDMVKARNRNGDDSMSNIKAEPMFSDRSIYKDGEYIGPVIDVVYGNIQVKAIVEGGKLIDVLYLEFPEGKKRTVEVSDFALPILKSEAISVQSAEVDLVSGATDLWGGFKESLDGALALAKK